MSFIPTGPYTLILSALVLAVSTACILAGSKPDKRVAAALLISLLFARLGTVTDNSLIGAAGMVLAAFIVLGGQTVACLTIAAFYGVRIMLAGLPIAGLLSTSMMAELTNFVLILQLVVASGGLLGGHVVAPIRLVGVRRANRLVYFAQVLAKRVVF